MAWKSNSDKKISSMKNAEKGSPLKPNLIEEFWKCVDIYKNLFIFSVVNRGTANWRTSEMLRIIARSSLAKSWRWLWVYVEILLISATRSARSWRAELVLLTPPRRRWMSGSKVYGNSLCLRWEQSNFYCGLDPRTLEQFSPHHEVIAEAAGPVHCPQEGCVNANV